METETTATVWVVSEFAWQAARSVEEAMFFEDGDDLETYKKFRKRIKFLRQFAEAEAEMQQLPIWEIVFTETTIRSITRQ